MKNKKIINKTESLVFDYIDYLNYLCYDNARRYHYFINYKRELCRVWHDNLDIDILGSSINYIKCLYLLELEIIIEEHNRNIGDK